METSTTTSWDTYESTTANADVIYIYENSVPGPCQSGEEIEYEESHWWDDFEPIDKGVTLVRINARCLPDHHL